MRGPFRALAFSRREPSPKGEGADWGGVPFGAFARPSPKGEGADWGGVPFGAFARPSPKGEGADWAPLCQHLDLDVNPNGQMPASFDVEVHQFGPPALRLPVRRH